MIRKNSYLLRVGLLSVVGKVVVDQVAIQMLCGNAIEAVNKAFQSAVVGVHALNVVKPELIDFHTL